MSKWRKKPKSRKPKTRSRGPYGLSVVEAGRMIGLGRNAAYQAAKEGRIPVMEMGALRIVPRLTWLRLIGADDAAVAAQPSKAAEA